jgi:uncharacterized protein
MSNLFVILGITDRCNLGCTYCYHPEGYINSDHRVMSSKVFESTIEKIMDESEDTSRVYWHGGEPLMGGKEFLTEGAKLVREISSKRRVRATNLISTNGTLLDPEWAEILDKNDFRVSVSCDGPKEIHDSCRQYSNGRGSYDNVERGIQLLRERNMGFGMLSVITKAAIGKEREMYDFVRSSGASAVKLHPFEVLGRGANNQEQAISPKEYGAFLKNFFDIMVEDPSEVRISPFTPVMQGMFGAMMRSCNYTTACNRFFYVGPEGEVYPCSRFNGVGDPLGNILDDSVEDLMKERKALIGEDHSLREPCDCDYYRLCGGGCPRNALEQTGDIHSKDYYSCQIRRDLYDHMKEFAEGALK